MYETSRFPNNSWLAFPLKFSFDSWSPECNRSRAQLSWLMTPKYWETGWSETGTSRGRCSGNFFRWPGSGPCHFASCEVWPM